MLKRKLGLILPLIGAVVLAAGCSSGGSVSSSTGSADFGSPPTADTGGSGGPCNGNPCIGDWQKAAAEGGTVVQCSDGTWSHAGGLSGACSDHGGEVSGQAPLPSQSSTTEQPLTGSGGSGGPCDGNPCIGDWQKEAAEGGTVVQCNDGTWSHAGGLSGACSDHGGESSGQPANAGSTPSPAPAPSNGGGVAVQDLPVQCGYGVAGSSGMTCTFAENAFYEFWQTSGGDPTQSESISVWSAEAGQSYPLACVPAEGVVDCTGINSSGASLNARFSQQAISAYTAHQAAAYAASGKRPSHPHVVI
jgi:hypothetical protein